MRLEAYLITESVKERVNFNSFEEMYTAVHNDCKPYFREFGNNTHFWRGITFTYKDTPDKLNIHKITPRTDRRSMNMPPDIQEYVNDVFKKKFGWRPRTEGVFTDIDVREAMEYGNSHMFYPIGEYKYIYNPDVRDLYIYTPLNVVSSYIHGYSFSDSFQKRLNEWLKWLDDYKDKGLKQNVQHGKGFEVVWKCKQYYLVDSDLDKQMEKGI